MTTLTLAECQRRDAALRAYFEARDWVGGEFGLARQFVLDRHLPQFPYVVDYEWEVVDGWSQAGRGDLILTDGDGRFAAVELKIARDRERRRAVEAQAKRYARAVLQRFVGCRWVEGYFCHSLREHGGAYLWGRHDATGWHSNYDLQAIGFEPEGAGWSSWTEWPTPPTVLTDYAELLQTVVDQAAALDERDLCLFATQRGAAYSTHNGLLVVGRAVNGWRTKLSLSARHPKGQLRELALAEILGGRATSPCALQWVQSQWGQGDGYRTSRSAFWRVARQFALDSGLPEERWTSRLAWSNLYRIAPAEGGNPSSALRDLQFERCVQCLRDDIDQLTPKRMLVLSGIGWFRPFADALGCELRRVEGEVWRGDLGKTQTVIAPHPQGKAEGPLNEAIARAWTVPPASPTPA